MSVPFHPGASFVLLVLVAACGSTSPTARQDQAIASAKPPPELQRQMREHFGIAIWARDVVIAGEIEPLREPLRELAALSYGAVDEAAQRRLAELQREAAAASKAATLSDAAAHVATIAGLCGECHREQGRGPRVTVEPEDLAGPNGTTADRMSQHRSGADQLWQGLVAPSSQAFQQGARFIARAPDVPSDPTYAAAWRELESLATRAGTARSVEARTRAYAELLVRCAQCHAVTGPLPLCFDHRAGDGTCRLASRR